MAANFWTSSHCTHWILDRRRVAEAMKEDLEYVNIDTLTKIKMWYYGIIGKIGKRLQFRQQVVATAIVYFKRFYTNMRSTDPSLVAATYLGGFDYDTSKVAEFEFYLLEELEFYLIVYHPYRDLTLIAKDLKLEESNLQTAWFVLNDSYRTDVCLFYAPHMIALAALYIICVVHAEQYNDNTNNGGGGGSGHSITNSGSSSNPNTMDDAGILGHNIHLAQLNSSNSAIKTPGAGGGSQNTPTSSSSSSSEGQGINNRNMVQWFADLNVDIEEIIEITQEILSLYSIWKDYEEEQVPAMMQALKMDFDENYELIDPQLEVMQ
ncbi:hypothetical protein BGZ89_002436 [Linnemannia elongata]|nr:hypothetical protein BGZ89_002436 [Linnemannia elongata]